MREGGWTVWNILKEGETEKRGGETKIFKMGGKLGQGVGALKRGAGTPHVRVRISGRKCCFFGKFCERNECNFVIPKLIVYKELSSFAANGIEKWTASTPGTKH